MVKHEILQCPRCHTPSECKLGSITLCQCSDVDLTDAQREWVAARWDGCLCKGCLLTIKRGECPN